jgi:hypothetical protein
MPELIERPSTIEAAGTKPKLIEEYVGRVNTGEERLSVARMRSPAGWVEPGQRPEFDEWTLVLDGYLRVEHDGGALDVRAGQAVLVRAGSGSATRRPRSRGRSTSRSACRRSPRTPSIATTADPLPCELHAGHGVRRKQCQRPAVVAQHLQRFAAHDLIGGAEKWQPEP